MSHAEACFTLSAPALSLVVSNSNFWLPFSLDKSQLTPRARVEREAQISPGTIPPIPPPKDTSHPYNPRTSQWDVARSTDFGNYRKDLAVLETSGSRLPSISRNSPSATSLTPPWPSSNGATMPTSVFGSFFNDSNEDIISPGFRPSSGKDERSLTEQRRPSGASAHTMSSSGSKSSISRGFHKKLQGFFGEEYPGDSRQNSDASLTTNPPYGAESQSLKSNRNRNNSVNRTLGSSVNSRPGSPVDSRPRTPLPSSEVTPWEFQDTKETSSQGESGQPTSEQLSTKSSRSGRGFHKPRVLGHRHNRSKDDQKTPEAREISQPYPLRPVTSREDSAYSVRRGNQHHQPLSSYQSRTNLTVRPASPTPSALSGMSQDGLGQKSPSTNKPRSIIDHIRWHKRKDKAERLCADQPMSSSSTTSLQPPASTRSSHTPPSPAHFISKKKIATDPLHKDTAQANGKESKKERHFGLKSSKRSFSNYEQPRGKDPNEIMPNEVEANALYVLDTNLNDLSDIVKTDAQPPKTPPIGDVATKEPEIDAIPKSRDPDAEWNAPDSWAIRDGENDASNYDEFDENEANNCNTYCVRIFRGDSTFATLSVTLNTTVAEIIQILGKKTLLEDDLSNYHIVMRKHDTSRQLRPHERPLMIQRQLLLQAGYTDADRIEDVGREDNSHLCRFTFIPAKMSGYSSLEKDPGFSKLSKFSHIDLSGRNLITIPIALYQKATEIISLNLSRNLSLDVPKDFIQNCSNLREIKYTSNEAKRLPPSLSLASRLTMLDISNNRLKQLEHAELHKLQSLQGLRLSNNLLTQLPSSFGQYRALRSLNLSSNSLNEFPDFLCEIRTLVDLDISFNSISRVPKLGQLICLERLWATNNKLSGGFPQGFRDLVNLREIDVRFNALDSMGVISQLPRLEYLMIGHNSVSAFQGTFPKIRVLDMNHNPVTHFELTAPVPTMSLLNLSSAKLAQLPDDMFQKITSLTKLVLDKNHFTSLSSSIGKLYKLEHLSVARNSLDDLPAEIGRLSELRFLDVRENNLARLPAELWHAKKLETLNASANVLDAFPKPTAQLPNIGELAYFDGSHTPLPTPGIGPNSSVDELGKLENFSGVAARRASQASNGYLGSSPVNAQRKNSIASGYGSSGTTRKQSVASRTATDGTNTPPVRKDSSLMNRLTTTFAGSLRHVFLADNRLSDDVFDELALLPELRIVNLSYNLIYDIPTRTIRRWQHLTQLYLSGNDLTSLPAEDLEEVNNLTVLHINNNKFQVLPAELGKVQKLAILDVGSNALKYNVSNWPYDWNWNWNHNLRYLNLSGNKRLEIKPSGAFAGGGAAMREGRDLTDFTSLVNLRVLGLMDVTMMVPSVPEQTEDRRIRTSGSTLGSMPYGMADSLGRNNHVSTMDMVVPRFLSDDDETLVGMFDGQPLNEMGSKIAKFLYDNFKHRFAEELLRMGAEETPVDALRRTYLSLNKDLALSATQAHERTSSTAPAANRPVLELGEADLNSGSVATVLYLKETELYISNVGDAQALLIRSEGGHKLLTRKHDPAEPSERARIREAGGFVSRQGKLNDILEVSRAFGYVQMSPCVIAAPHVTSVTLGETDEMILVASRELWEYLTPDFAVDVARSERGDLMRAAQKLRDLAIAFGATNKIMVMLLGVSDLKNKQRARFRTLSMSMGPSNVAPEEVSSRRPGKRSRNAIGDSKLARLDNEVDAPTGEVSLVFTDIKNSTMLWETYPIAMRSAIKMHNELMRRQLRIIGGYEVKTEGDAFMVAFPTVTSALLWCFAIQSQLLEVPWPHEILSSVNGQEVFDPDGNVIFRGLSVRMGIHYGRPVCEVDPVTKRMDYFGPMVNRASRISSVADGGQITVSSDFIAEIQRLLETHFEAETGVNGSLGSEEGVAEDALNQSIRHELRALGRQGFEVKDLGERRLKGLENPEYVYLMYPHSLASRLTVQREPAPSKELPPPGTGQVQIAKKSSSPLIIDTQDIWDLWNVSLRLEMMCSTLENPDSKELKPPETALLERMKNRGGEITDRFVLNFVEHQISRIETCVTTLAVRNMVRPFGTAPLLQQACPMQDILGELAASLKELQRFREDASSSFLDV
ncbi:PP2C-domain-containing protein [Delitschia confertaspora ATCC 74209]|uniref:Adenylate cyclase n=1 Tax=Delitschia confertaspora ATCC 74209 TaxID=1513339 RepID=A0A9P4JJG3_9PLEO|nr:PP2C-domain-containing protein [Delitschia confertaspora ATCC 74209]